MKLVLSDIDRWLAQGHEVALATLVATMGSSPREVGATLAVNSAGEVAGSISNGCLEGVLVEEALGVIATDSPRLLTFEPPDNGETDLLSLSLGLTCGGTMQVYVERLTSPSRAGQLPLSVLLEVVRNAKQHPVAICTRLRVVDGEGNRPSESPNLDTSAPDKLVVFEDGQCLGSLGNPGIDHAVANKAKGLLGQGQSHQSQFGLQGECGHSDVAVFIEALTAPPHLLMFGAVAFSRALCQFGRLLGYQTTVCDARSMFATPARLPEADSLETLWPQDYFEQYGATIGDRTAILVLTHDPKFDIPALEQAVKTTAFYIGAMGSRKTHAERLARLREAGLSETQIHRIAAPTGLDLGGHTLEETALSILAEMVALRHGRQGGRLAHSREPIHNVSIQEPQVQEVWR
ncbi:MAG: XdhC/CoxI family protein [Synechococcaceae cyanobacterium SM2_3_2]|nr:XdhC/CoxI family protein [Synechococcaceae cyanobacterium SM2_3_2]